MTVSRALAPPGGLGALRADHRLFGLLVWATTACSALVWREPAPYELLLLPTMALLFLFGLPMRRAQAPLLVFAVLIGAGGLIAMNAVRYEYGVALQYVVVTIYLLVTSLFFAAFVADDPLRHGRIVVGGTVAAGVIASLTAVAGYGAGIDFFMRYGRAKGTFEDPNVLGAFLLLPICALLAAVLTRPPIRGLVPLVLLGLTVLGLFLSFSRAAWGLLILSGALTVFFVYATSGENAERRRIAGLAALGAVFAVAGLAVALSLPSTAALIADRAQLTQSYDSGYMGRFDRYNDAMLIILSHPFGFGSVQFRQYFPEEIHSVYLNVLLAYGWTGGLAYLVMTGWTLVKCMRLLQRRDALRTLTIPVAAAFIGLAVEGLIIDTDHWRHWFLALGLVWGLDRAPPTTSKARRGAHRTF